MKNRLYRALALAVTIIFVFSACGTTTTKSDNDSKTSDETSEISEEISDEDDEADAVTDNGSPWINACIKKNVTEDMETNPKDDLYLYVNKDWILDNSIPDGDSSYSLYASRAKDVEKETIALLKDEAQTSDSAKLCQTLYNLCLDWDARNELGVTPLEDTFKNIEKAASISDITELITEEDSEVSSFISVYVGPGISDSSTNYLYFYTPSLILDDSANYTEMSEYGEILYDYYKDIYVYLAKRLGEDDSTAEEQFENAIAFETKLAENIMTDEETMASDYDEKINNVMTYDELTKLNSVYPLIDILKSSGIDYEGECIVTSPDYFKSLDEIFCEDNFELIRDELLVNYVLDNKAYLDYENYVKTIELYNEYFGVEGTTTEDEMAYDVVSTLLPDQISQLYIENYSSEEDKENVEKICYEVIDTYSEMLKDNTWASDETKEYAIKKLQAMTVNVGWPETWDDFSSLSIDDCSYIEACNIISDFEFELLLKDLGQPVDSSDWVDGSLLECNAYYNPSDNSINMILGMMGEPFYSADMSTEDLYASLAAFWIGHEVSHAFDSNGAQYDVDGNLNNWWSDEDLEKFNSRVEKMDNYLDSILVMGDYYVNGSNVDSEMIADMTGVQCALKMAEKVDNFDYEEFFKYYAYMNTSIETYSTILYYLESDVHPIDYLRVNVPVQQFDEFYEAFDVEEGDGMYLAPDERVTIW